MGLYPRGILNCRFELRRLLGGVSGVDEGSWECNAPRSRYWMLRRGLRSDLTTLWACSAMYWTNNSWKKISIGALEEGRAIR